VELYFDPTLPFAGNLFDRHGSTAHKQRHSGVSGCQHGVGHQKRGARVRLPAAR
jgi:hypothetical protein